MDTKAILPLLACWLLAAPLAAQEDAGALAVLPRYDAAAALDRFFYFRLDDGTGFAVDRVRRNALEVRQIRLPESLFAIIGRPVSESAVAGEILLEPLRNADDSTRSALLVETSTGYAAYFEQLGRGGGLGEIRTTVGRPFAPLAVAGGNFVLLSRRAANGRTVDVGLYRTDRGDALRLAQVDDLPQQPRVSPVAGLPALGGRAAAAALQSGGGRTLGFLLFDEATGAVHQITLGDDGSIAGSRRREENLFEHFPRDAEAVAGSARFLAVPVRIDGQITRHVLLIDAASGRLALFANADGALASPTLLRIDAELDSVLGAGPRALAAVPRVGQGGATSGVWILDAASDRMVFASNLDRPEGLTLNRVTLIR